MDIVFAVMPFADAGRPAIGVSLLKAAAQREGYSASILYGCLQLADRMGGDLYQKVSSHFAPDLLVGEWFFADELFGADIPPEEDYVNLVLAQNCGPDLVREILASRRQRTQWLDDTVREISALKPRIVGFTTTFHQTCASLAVARRLKALPEPPIIIFGGANCEGEMGLQLLESFPWIDYICCGEADISIIKLLNRLLRGGEQAIPGVLEQGQSKVVVHSEAIQDMDSLPIPDYDDYFEQLSGTSLGRKTAIHVIVETSRGCWWGAKHHCTFCGLNGDTMAFRSKSPNRAYDEITHLCRKHDLAKVGCVDNILDMRYIDTLFPRLAASGLQLEMFYEVKANLRLDQLRKLYQGGMRQIQPGIESFSNEVLRLMEKGVTGFQNVQLLRWCEEIGIECAWNLLAGFPGETQEEYDKMARLVPLLTHLNPPLSCAQVRLDRFSPFHFRAESFGFRKMRPARAYYFVYPLERRELSRLAYFFDFDYGDGRNPLAYLNPVRQEVQKWWTTHLVPETRSILDARFEGDEIIVTDTRAAARAPLHRLSGLHGRLFFLCDTATSLAALLRRQEFRGCEAEVREGLEALIASGLLAQDEEHYLTLAVFRNRPAARPETKSNAYVTVSETLAPEPLLRVV